MEFSVTFWDYQQLHCHWDDSVKYGCLSLQLSREISRK